MTTETTIDAGTNEAAGKFFGDDGLARKRDSLYSPREWDLLLNYLNRGNGSGALQGVVDVTGGMTLGEGRRLQIADGALITEGTVRLAKGSSLEVTHSAATRTLPSSGVTKRESAAVLSGRNVTSKTSPRAPSFVTFQRLNVKVPVSGSV